MTKKVQLKNVGPISGTFEFALDAPGLYELRGSSGVGKSTVLSALGLIAGHKVDLTIHDGELDGRVAGLGVVAPIGGRKRRQGELQLEVLDSAKFDLADLIDPDGQTPETRDKTRLKALAALSGLELSPEDLGVTADDVEVTKDPILLASRAKSALEKQARRIEDRTERNVGEATALWKQGEELDLSEEHDAETLTAKLEGAVQTCQRLEQSRSEGLSQEKRATEAQEKLQAIDTSGPTAEEILEQMTDKGSEIQAIKDKIAVLEKSLDREKQALDELGKQYKQRQALETAVEECKEAIQVQAFIPSEEEIEKAKEKRQQAREAVERGALIREALAAHRKADAITKECDEWRKEAKAIRDKAKSVFEELAKRLQLESIRVESIGDALRLVVEHPKRGKTLYDKVDGLSDGERVRWALTELLHRFDKPGLMPIPQRVYQDLQPLARKELATYAKEHGLYLVGAQVTDGELEVVEV